MDGSNFSRRRRSLSVNRLKLKWVPANLWLPASKWSKIIWHCGAGMKMFRTPRPLHLKMGGPADWGRPPGDNSEFIYLNNFKRQVWQYVLLWAYSVLNNSRFITIYVCHSTEGQWFNSLSTFGHLSNNLSDFSQDHCKKVHFSVGFCWLSNILLSHIKAKISFPVVPWSLNSLL